MKIKILCLRIGYVLDFPCNWVKNGRCGINNRKCIFEVVDQK